MIKLFKDIVILRGGGDIATGIAHRLHRSGFKILILDINKPTMVRRTVSLASAIFYRDYTVDGVKAVKADNLNEINKIWNDKNIPIIVDENLEILNEIKPDILIDAILAKKNLGTKKDIAPITIGVGPGFSAGIDVNLVVETCRGHDLGRVIFEGSAKPNTGIPGIIAGYGKERVIKSPCAGKIKNISKIGDIAKRDDIIAYVDEEPVKATLDGVLRGLIMDGLNVEKGLKIGDIDPRGVVEHCFSISDKARAVGGGVLEAILYLKNQMKDI
jgi:xanthine dehydrogenase accessory factor